LLGPLVLLECPPVPDPDRAGAVLAGRDVALKLEVLERVILGPDRQPILGPVRRNSVRHRPRSQRPVVLQPQVPVKSPRVVLVDHKAGLSRGLGDARPRRLWRGLKASLAAVGVELVVWHLASRYM